MLDPNRPFNDLPLLPPAIDLETKAVLKAVTRASRTLAELKGHTNTIPNPQILLSTISLQEARSSSEIENIFTTNDELYRGLSLDELGLSPEQKEVLHYNEALWKGAATLRQRPFLSTGLFIEIRQYDQGQRRRPAPHPWHPHRQSREQPDRLYAAGRRGRLAEPVAESRALRQSRR